MVGNVIRLALGEETMREVSTILRASIRYSLEHRDAALEYAMGFGRGLDKDKADRFVAMWVNELTVDYGDYGKKAVRTFLTAAADAGILPAVESLDFY